VPSADAISPKSLVLDLLRVAAEPQPVRGLCEIGSLFGFTNNAMRVAVTRLVGRGLLESDERGWYRLASVATPRADFVERWRQGERRVRAWKGQWLTVWLPKGAPRAVRRRSLSALAWLGFREGLPGMYVRPDNLAGVVETVRLQATPLGLEAEAELFVSASWSDPLVRRWTRELWPAGAIRARCRDATRELERSAARLLDMPGEQAVVQAFQRGGKAIGVLATDPLLPDAIVDGTERRALTEATLRYDALGRRVWERFMEARHLEAAPVHLAVVDGTGGQAA